MRVRCERCKTIFTLELTPPPTSPFQAQCGRCGLVFTVRAELPKDAPPGPPKPPPDAE
ncbi:MAG: zinc-ribbon domain-containing protein [Myxococcales bacterium]